MGFAYVKLIFHEAFIVLRYAIFPTVLCLLLTYIRWNLPLIISLIKLLVFIRLLHNEDRRTSSMHFRYLLTKIAVTMIMFYLTRLGVAKMQENYFPNILASANGTRKAVEKVTISRSKAKLARMAKLRTTTWGKAKYFGLQMLMEYLFMCNSVAQYRLTYLALVFLVYGTMQVMFWLYLRDKKKNEDGTQNESSSGSENDASNYSLDSNQVNRNRGYVQPSVNRSRRRIVA